MTLAEELHRRVHAFCGNACQYPYCLCRVTPERLKREMLVEAEMLAKEMKNVTE